MGNLYNAIFGVNPATVLIAPMLTEERPESYFPRFRDCYVEDGNIVVYTRVGGGNRSYETRPPYRCSYDEGDWEANYDFGENKLYELPTFLWTYDDDFDSTYGYYVFGVPDEWKADFERVMAGNLGELSDAYVGRFVRPGGAYRIVITDYLSTRSHCSADLCPACKDRMAACARAARQEVGEEASG